ncbi:MAG TPA: hypothetical protein VJ673_10355 [Aromatoleum sp.]|uniref:hypothetical protein n=1 Tax=Aromatoleum sp. TaxID=2307007 RepID=UPI002B46DD4C|nr:hypothetical protein [Aromatoleum sp.]HJV26084.1 hypothetical protein [Aromatoleum sp.]
MDSGTTGHHTAPSFQRLLYRYLWPFQYFRDVTRGGCLERQQNYRHNRAMRRYLPGFIAKWIFLTALWFFIGGTMHELGVAALAAGCFIVAIWTLIVVVVLGVDWLWLERFPELF